jgi:hypothetical protein
MITEHEKKTIDTCVDSLYASLKSRPPQQRQEALCEIGQYCNERFQKLLDLIEAEQQVEAQSSPLTWSERLMTKMSIAAVGEGLLFTLKSIIDRNSNEEQRRLAIFSWFELLEESSQGYMEQLVKLLEGMLPPYSQQDSACPDEQDTLTDEERTQAQLGILRARDSIRARTPANSGERYNGLYDLVILLLDEAKLLADEADNTSNP